MGRPGHRPELVGEMLRPAFYPSDPPSVELRETHTSWVFLAGDRAYKVKKPVTFPFLDYGTAERRRQMCREEVRLNQRLAPRIYLDVAGIARTDGGYALTSGDDPDAVEYAVAMRRVDESRSLAALAGRGELEPAHVRAVARRLARFHAEAPVAPGDLRDVEPLVATLEENLSTLRRAGGGIIDGRRLHAAERFTHAFLDARRRQLDVRGRAGMVRDCHGDLRAEHVIVPKQGELYVYDCIEFNRSLRQIDVGADLAFLVMDLARLGAEDAALRLGADYRAAGGDPGDDPLVAFFASYRAWVRAKIDCLRALELTEADPDRRPTEDDARKLIDLGHSFAWRARAPLVLVLAGVSGSGKTTLAGRLAELSGWGHVSSDVTRKRLAGLRPGERARPEHYSREMTMRTYEAMGTAAGAENDRAGGVIVDATFQGRDERAAFLEGLGGRSPRLILVECTAPEDTLRARVLRRAEEPERVSDADPEVLARQLAEREPFTETALGERAELDTDKPVEDLAAELEGIVDRLVWPRGESG